MRYWLACKISFDSDSTRIFTKIMNSEEDFQTNSTNLVFAVLEHYGWYILIIATAFAYAFHKAKPYMDDYLKKKDAQAYAAKYHKNPDLLTERFDRQQRVALQLQQRYDEDAEKHRLKMEEREAKKREEYLEKLEGKCPGRKLGSSADGSKSLKSDYNPLMGSSSRNYKPTRKSPCGGGGCGK